MSIHNWTKGAHSGRLLRQNRERLNLSQIELARLLGYTKAQFLSNVERGKCALPPKLVRPVASLFSIPEEVVKDAVVRDIMERLEFEVMKRGPLVSERKL